MDVEKTMQFILEQQAKTAILLDNAARRADRQDKRIDGHDKRLEAIAKLVRAGMKMLVELGEAQKLTERRMAELSAEHRRTEKMLQAFLASMRRGGNGRSRT